MRRIRYVLLAAAVAATGLTGLGGLRAQPAQAAVPVGPFHVDGPLIRDGNGQPFYVRGVARAGLNAYCYPGDTAEVHNGDPVLGQIQPIEFQRMASWGANTVRIPISQVLWAGAAVPGSSCPTYLTSVRQAVTNAEAAGLAVILDLHGSGNGVPGGDPSIGSCMADAGSAKFWYDVATAYASDPLVFFELHNEPHDVSWQTWRGGGLIVACNTAAAPFVAVGMQQLINVIRQAGAQNVVIAGGVNWASDLTGVDALLTGGNVAYAAHVYDGTSIYVASEDERDWLFGALASRAPVVVTEFGQLLTCNNNVPDPVNHPYTYGPRLLQFLRERGIGFTAWAWGSAPWGHQGCTDYDLLLNDQVSCSLLGCPVRDEMLGLQSGALTEGPPPPVPSYPTSSLRYSFEASTQGWYYAWGAGMQVNNLPGIADDGQYALDVTLTGTSSFPAVGVSAPPGLVGGRLLTMRVWSSTPTPVGVRLMIRDNLNALNYDPAVTYLEPGWNDVRWLLPASGPVNSLVVQFDNPTGVVGHYAIDSVRY